MQAANAKNPQVAATVPTVALAGGADPILNKKQTSAIVGLSPSTIDRSIPHAFPPPVQLSARRVGWRLSTIQAWLEARPARGAPKPTP